MNGPHRLGSGLPHSRRSFTLVELLVAMAVTALLFAFVAQIISVASHAFNDDRKRMDAWDQARVVFDRIGFDWNGRVRSSQVPSFVVKPPAGTLANDSFVLISATPSLSGDRPFSVVQYEMEASAGQGPSTLALQRGSLGFSFTNAANGNPTDLSHPTNFFLNSDNPAPLDFGGNDADLFQPLGDGVFAVQIAFLTAGYTNTDGTWVNPGIQSLPVKLPVNPSWPMNGVTNGWPNATPTPSDHIVDLTSTNIVAMVVGVAILDTASRKMMTDAQFTALTGQFTYPETATNTPVAYWNENVLNDTFYRQTPIKAYQNVKVYQRFFYAK